MPNRRMLLACAMLAFALPAVGQQQPKLPKPGKAAKIVFVGNSYTHYHDLPAFVRALGELEKPRREVTTVMLAPGGFTLQGHWNATDDRAPQKIIASERPDYVVLQEQSTMPFQNPEQMETYAAKFTTLIEKKKATPVWYMTWAKQQEPERQDAISEQYEKVHRQNGGLLAPVGRAWQAVQKQYPDQKLHVEDGSHPNPSGTYVAACVLYGTMFGGDVTTFPDKLVTKGPDGKDQVLIELPPEEGTRLRAAAAAVLAKDVKQKSGHKRGR